MPRETVEIDPSSPQGKWILSAWCAYPNHPDKRAAYLAVLHYHACAAAEAAGEAVGPWPWSRVKSLGGGRLGAAGIIDGSNKALERAIAAALIAERLLEGPAKLKDLGAADEIACEIQDYHKRKGTRGGSRDDVIHRSWSPYKTVVHLVLALTQVRREMVFAALPSDLQRLTKEEVIDLLWRYKQGDPEARAALSKPLAHELGPEDIALVLEISEKLRLELTGKPKIRIKEKDTIQFVAAQS